MSPNNRISRRQFLGHVGAAAAVPLFIPAGVLAAPAGPAPTTASASPASASAGKGRAIWPTA